MSTDLTSLTQNCQSTVCRYSVVEQCLYGPYLTNTKLWSTVYRRCAVGLCAYRSYVTTIKLSIDSLLLCCWVACLRNTYHCTTTVGLTSLKLCCWTVCQRTPHQYKTVGRPIALVVLLDCVSNEPYVNNTKMSTDCSCCVVGLCVNGLHTNTKLSVDQFLLCCWTECL